MYCTSCIFMSFMNSYLEVLPNKWRMASVIAIIKEYTQGSIFTLHLGRLSSSQRLRRYLNGDASRGTHSPPPRLPAFPPPRLPHCIMSGGDADGWAAVYRAAPGARPLTSIRTHSRTQSLIHTRTFTDTTTDTPTALATDSHGHNHGCIVMAGNYGHHHEYNNKYAINSQGQTIMASILLTYLHKNKRNHGWRHIEVKENNQK